MSSLLMDIVGNDQKAVGGRVGRIDHVSEVVFCVLDQQRRVIVIIISIEIEEGDVVTKR